MVLVENENLGDTIIYGNKNLIDNIIIENRELVLSYIHISLHIGDKQYRVY